MEFTKQSISKTLDSKLKETLANMYQETKESALLEAHTTKGKITDNEIKTFMKVSKDTNDLKYPLKTAEKLIRKFVAVQNKAGNVDFYKTEEKYKFADKKEEDLIGFFLNQVDAYRE